mmetsp:Transcript_4577/g.8741  ORF Transcript_4577/g.8741 Transcript_4577/m.8741 type:complete len:225 (-) Transcript_4577:2850-3524(-)
MFLLHPSNCIFQALDFVCCISKVLFGVQLFLTDTVEFILDFRDFRVLGLPHLLNLLLKALFFLCKKFGGALGSLITLCQLLEGSFLFQAKILKLNSKFADVVVAERDLILQLCFDFSVGALLLLQLLFKLGLLFLPFFHNSFHVVFVLGLHLLQLLLKLRSFRRRAYGQIMKLRIFHFGLPVCFLHGLVHLVQFINLILCFLLRLRKFLLQLVRIRDCSLQPVL